MFNNKMNYRVGTYFYGVKMNRFGLESNISIHNGNIRNLNGKNLGILNSENLLILNGENLYDMINGELGKYPDSLYWISIVFICSDKSVKWVPKSVGFCTSTLINYEEFCDFCEEFFKYVKEHRAKIKLETGLDSSVVDVVIHDDEDLNVIYEDELA
jgi:hypothetical protein